MSFHVNNSTPQREAEAHAYLSGTVRLSLALRLERRDGQAFAFTDAEEDVSLGAGTWGNIIIPATNYQAGMARFPKNLSQSRDPRKVDSWEFVALTGEEAGYISEADVVKGLFREARYSLIFFARDALFQWLRMRGKVGAKVVDKGSVVWKMNGLSRALGQDVLEVTSPLSRAKWGDPALSTTNLNGQTADGWAFRVTGVASNVDVNYPRRSFVLSGTQGFPNTRFSDGTVEFLTGANAGLVASILDFDSAIGRIVLDEVAPSVIAPGVQIRAQVRAPQTLEEWVLYFGTGFGFPGEPQIPNAESANSQGRD